MKSIWTITGWLGLFLTLFPAILLFWGDIGFSLYKQLMLIGCALWFGSKLAVNNVL